MNPTYCARCDADTVLMTSWWQVWLDEHNPLTSLYRVTFECPICRDRFAYHATRTELVAAGVLPALDKEE